MSEFMKEISTIALAIVGIAILAVLVSRNAQTPSVIQSAASGFSQSILAAESPVTGSGGYSGGYGSGYGIGFGYGG